MKRARCAATDDIGVSWVVAKMAVKPPPFAVAGRLHLQSRQCDETDAGGCRDWDVPRDYGESQGVTYARSAVTLLSGGRVRDAETEDKVPRCDVAEWPSE